MPNYGNDRIFKSVVKCPNCGGDHIEMEFKRLLVLNPEFPNATHKGRCPKSHSSLYIEDTSYN